MPWRAGWMRCVAPGVRPRLRIGLAFSLMPRWAAAIAPNARFVQIEHAGHAPFLTHADAVADALLGFLDDVSRHSREGGNPELALLNGDGRLDGTGPRLSEAARLRGNDEQGHE